jgi:hypothetical protein
MLVENESARKQILEQLHGKRKQVVRLHRQGIKVMKLRACVENPVAVAIGGTRQTLSMIATVTNQCKAHWIILDEAFDADKRIEFLHALIKEATYFQDRRVRYAD